MYQYNGLVSRYLGRTRICYTVTRTLWEDLPLGSPMLRDASLALARRWILVLCSGHF